MKKLPSFILAMVVSAPLLTAFGCAESGNKPYSLTGDQNLTDDQRRWVNQHSIDQKGHFNPVLHQQAMDQMRRANQGAQ